MKPKLLLYCTKAKPYLADFKGEYQTYSNGKELDELFDKGFNLNDIMNILNGKIAAECDFEVEDLRIVDDDPLGAYWYETKTLSENEVLKKSCLTGDELFDYLGEDNEGYAIHIKNLHIFDKPRDIRNYYNIATRTMADCMNQKALLKAPQNMCNAYDVYKNHYILISIQPQWLCKILNGEKTIEVRKKVLKEMLE